MKQPSVSIRTLRIFAAAARDLSFSRAAAALHLTQGAVSKHIRSLEDGLGTALFLRHARGLHLTEAGTVYLEHIATALKAIDHATERLADLRGRENRIALGAPPAVAEWVTHSLARFMEQNADLSVVLRPRQASAPRGIGAESTGALDAEIRYGAGTWPGMRARYLLGRETSLVASPALLRRITLTHPADVFSPRVPLLRHLHVPAVWTEWAREMGLGARTPEPEAVSDYEQYAMLVPAAMAGLGLAVVPRFLVTAQLLAGQLVAPFGEIVRAHPGYYLLASEQLRLSTAFQRLSDHLAREAARTTRAACASRAAQARPIPDRNR